jgi:peptidoglycan lytic transglycosylase
MLPRLQSRRLRLCLVLLGVLGAAVPGAALDLAGNRSGFRAALAAATRNESGWRTLAAAVDPAYPLYPYIELAALRARLPRADRAEIERFLARWPGTLAATDLRDAYLRELARRGDWTTFRAVWKDSTERDLVCDDLRARIAAGAAPDYATDLQPLWEGARSLPGACDPVFADARARGVLGDDAIWQRIERSAEAGNADAAADAAGLLSGDARVAADRIVSALRDPAAALAKAATWPDDARARDALSFGLARYARRDSAAAETAWAAIQDRFHWSEPQKDRVLAALALYRATSYAPDALARLKALPPEAANDATREWHVRVALAASDWKEALAALDRLSAGQQADPRWRYLRARVLGKLGRRDEAAALLTEVARDAGFYGFLAADWLDRPYAICPRTLAADAAGETALARQADLARAFEFRELGMLPQARREWAFAMTRLDEPQRRLAADLASRRGWYDRAVFAFSADPQTQRLYEQRFPLAMESQLRREAHAAGVDPAWAYAIIRAESAWMTDAHSGADAYGLMQLLPGVAKALAKAEKLPYGNPQDLFDPALNIALGTRFLGRMAGKYDGSPWLASAAYNAGEAPVGRWLDARGGLEPDFFIETIPYRETREYVARVLAFSVIYDWRMHGSALALSARMPKIGQPWHAPGADTPRKAVACPAADAAVPATAADAGP